MNIFIVNNQGHDLTSLDKVFPNTEKKIVYLTEGRVDLFKTDKLKQQIKTAMIENGITENDYVVPTGASSIVSIATICMIELTGSFNTLLYHFDNKEYIRREGLYEGSN